MPRTADEIVAAVSPTPTPGVANGARYVVALPFPRGANGGTRGTRSTSPSRRGSVDKCSRPSRSVAIAGVRRAVTRYPQVPPAQARPPAPALVVPRCCVRAFRVARTCAPHLAGALVVVGWAAPLRAGLIAELGDGAAGRGPRAGGVRSAPAWWAPANRPPTRSECQTAGRPAPGYARPTHTALRTPRSPWRRQGSPRVSGADWARTSIYTRRSASPRLSWSARQAPCAVAGISAVPTWNTLACPRWWTIRPYSVTSPRPVVVASLPACKVRLFG